MEKAPWYDGFVLASLLCNEKDLVSVTRFCCPTHQRLLQAKRRAYQAMDPLEKADYVAAVSSSVAGSAIHMEQLPGTALGLIAKYFRHTKSGEDLLRGAAPPRVGFKGDADLVRSLVRVARHGMHRPDPERIVHETNQVNTSCSDRKLQ